ncbi:putative flavoprotein involved in K+ transport [Microlunatus sagamiharensis]|uniref:Putative flavoprotein involved in K+ transport n=1 Tax=Microlunatus sagamiharensis TaxID=546874 RepID=A0A1H2M4W4_9ACTN|nr:MSMEG_0569 family flavin-dependent oxidoreductase [Microlunatus sagamiharensis]SDU87536.1 putative flavoprotein involved in K+ transport [Microlunatus sagamiharensis]
MTATDPPTDAATSVEHVEVAVVGGGQAGLSASWFLARAGVEHVVLERATAGHDWQDRRWDSFTLVTPNVQCRLPGYPYPGDDPYGFMTREQTVAYLAEYVRRTRPPLREQTTVVELRQGAGGGFVLDLDSPDGRSVLHAEQVVVAVGGYHRPRVPRLAERLPDDLVQVHSAAYKSPELLPDGAVLVVGTGQSGAQIAEDLHLAGRQVHLVVGSAPRCARRYRGRDCIDWLEEMGLYDVAVEDTPGGLRARAKTNHYMTGRDGGHDIDLRRFALEGMALYGRLVGVDGSHLGFAPTLEASLDHADQVAESIKDAIDRHVGATGVEAPTEPRYVPVWRPPTEPDALDLRAAGITSVVWATGFTSDFGWVRVPVFDGRGAVGHHRGVTAVEGLHFLGLPWLHTWGSGRFAGLTRDAEHVVDHVVARAAAGTRPQRHLRLTS